MSLSPHKRTFPGQGRAPPSLQYSRASTVYSWKLYLLRGPGVDTRKGYLQTTWRRRSPNTVNPKARPVCQTVTHHPGSRFPASLQRLKMDGFPLSTPAGT
jgi:hypothetical protein